MNSKYSYAFLIYKTSGYSKYLARSFSQFYIGNFTQVFVEGLKLRVTKNY